MYSCGVDHKTYSWPKNSEHNWLSEHTTLSLGVCCMLLDSSATLEVTRLRDSVPFISYWTCTKNFDFLLVISVLGVIIFSLLFFVSFITLWMGKWCKSELTDTGYTKIHACWQVLTDHVNQRVIASVSTGTSVSLQIRRGSWESPVFLISQRDLAWIDHAASQHHTGLAQGTISRKKKKIILRFICWVKLQNVTLKYHTHIMRLSVSMILLHSWDSRERFRELNKQVDEWADNPYNIDIPFTLWIFKFRAMTCRTDKTNPLLHFSK